MFCNTRKAMLLQVIMSVLFDTGIVAVISFCLLYGAVNIVLVTTILMTGTVNYKNIGNIIIINVMIADDDSNHWLVFE